jgi:spore germination protein KA
VNLNKDPEYFIGDLMMSKDLEKQQLTNGKFNVDLYFFNSLCDLAIIRSCISEPLIKSQTPEDFLKKLESNLSCQQVKEEELEQLSSKLLQGKVLIRFELMIIFGNKNGRII